MKTKILKLSYFALLLFTFYGCCDDCNKELDVTKGDLKKTQDSLNTAQIDQAHYLELDHLNKILFPAPENGNIVQESILIKDIKNRSEKLERYKAYGSFNTKNNTIKVNIPITENKLRIVNYENISSDDINALLIVLDGNSGKDTPFNSITKIIKKQFNIKKLGLNTVELKKDGKLIIIVLHDDNFNYLHTIKYKKCINRLSDYDGGYCTGIDKSKPNEDGGDIIPGE